eukprot:gene7550-7056_t
MAGGQALHRGVVVPPLSPRQWIEIAEQHKAEGNVVGPEPLGH